MWTRQYRQRKTGRLILPAVALAFLSYFGFHAWHGEFGIYSKYELEQRTADRQNTLDEIRVERMALETRVALLRDGTIEKDTLDEHARHSLNMAHPDELVILRRRD
jgi:cell division protein FtsB